MGDVYTERNKRGNDSLKILSVSIHHGVSNEELDSNTLGKEVRRSEDKSLYKHVYFGDLVLNMMRAWQGAVGVVKSEAMVSPAYITAVPSAELYPLFMDFYLRRDEAIGQMNNLSYGVTDFRKRLYWDSFVKVVCHIPTVAEQEKITAFFTHLDKTIALHQEKQRQIRSLKQGFIKNLFPNNKNSAPRIRFAIFNDDWNQRSASEIFTSVADKNYPELPVLSASQEKGMVLRESNGINIKYDQKSTGTYKRVLPGQFIMHLRSFQGGFAYSTIEGITSPAYTILAFRNKEDHYPLFWKSIFSSKNFIKRLEAITYGIRDGRSISYADFSTLRFWIPSYEEQKQIGDFLESIDATIAFYQRQIDMMQSLKKELLNNMFI
nr:restriction endonuclease subunit S [uncultured Trichococcus sp.]